MKDAILVIVGIAGGLASSEWLGGYRIRRWQRDITVKAKDNPPGTIANFRASLELKARGFPDPQASAEARRQVDYFWPKWRRKL